MNIHLPSINMPPKDFEVSRRGVCSCKQALNLCLEQGYINTNNFFGESCSRNTQLCWRLTASLRTEGIIVVQQLDLVVLTQRFAKTGTMLWEILSARAWNGSAWNKMKISWCVLHRREQEIGESKSNNPATVNVHRPSFFFIHSCWSGPRWRFEDKKT